MPLKELLFLFYLQIKRVCEQVFCFVLVLMARVKYVFFFLINITEYLFNIVQFIKNIYIYCSAPNPTTLEMLPNAFCETFCVKGASFVWTNICNISILVFHCNLGTLEGS